jgi:hypothetical protein
MDGVILVAIRALEDGNNEQSLLLELLTYN